jgi:hypothetical protein
MLSLAVLAPVSVESKTYSNVETPGATHADDRLHRSDPDSDYYDDHGVPHFRAVSPDFDFKMAIADCSIISGNGRLRGRDLAAIRAWGQNHRDALYSNWQLAREGKPLQDIGD